MENPHEDTAFLRVVNFPTRGIGARSIEQLQDQARQRGISLYAAAEYLEGKAGGAVRTFVSVIESLRFETQGLALKEMVAAMLDRSGLIRHYETEKEGRERIENLQELVNAAAAFLAEERFSPEAPANLGVSGANDDDTGLIGSPLSMFLSHASLEAGDNQAAEGQDAVQLMTIHSAKGLEFYAVFLTGLEEGLFPHENSISEPDGLSEERRLMYVAITRARQRLYISMAQTRMLHGQTRYNLRSRFLEELPQETLRWLTPRVDNRWSGAGSSGALAEAAPAGRWVRQGMGDRGSASPSFQKPAIAGHTHDSGFYVGQAVRHSRFGDGVILALEGSGSEGRAQVNFKRDGPKWLALGVAKLEATD